MVKFAAIFLGLVFAAATLRVQAAPVDPTRDTDLQKQLEIIRQKYKLPALAGAIVTSKGLVKFEAVGVRKAGTDVAVTRDDQWHLGSETKAMTALVIASLVQQGKLQWNTTIEQLFPSQAKAYPPTFRKITVVELLSHHAGLPANLDWPAISRFSDNLIEQRQKAMKNAANGDLPSTPGTAYLYSNLGYVIVAAMAEKVTGRTWEDLITTIVFKPLGMDSAGFGGTGTAGKIDQPWGHTADGQPVKDNGPAMDNPEVMGPAGTVHCTMQDWAKFIADQLRGESGQRALLSVPYYHKMHEPQFGGDYALGWVILQRPWGGGNGVVYNHAGSNTMNNAVVWVAPKRDFAVLVCTNQAGPDADKACEEVAKYLIDQVN